MTEKNDKDILRLRAERLAASQEAVAADVACKVVEFRIGRERFGIETGYVESLSSQINLQRLPGQPRHIDGVMNVHGRIVAVLNTGELVGSSLERGIGPYLTMVLKGAEFECAVLIDECSGIRDVLQEEIESDQGALASLDRKQWISAVTIGGLQIINGERMLSETSLIVDEEVPGDLIS